MKTIKITDTSPNLGAILDLASDDNVILKTSDGREFVLAEVDSFDREIELVRQNQELMDFLEKRSEDQNVYTLDQAKQKLNIK